MSLLAISFRFIKLHITIFILVIGKSIQICNFNHQKPGPFKSKEELQDESGNCQENQFVNIHKHRNNFRQLERSNQTEVYSVSYRKCQKTRSSLFQHKLYTRPKLAVKTCKQIANIKNYKIKIVRHSIKKSSKMAKERKNQGQRRRKNDKS